MYGMGFCFLRMPCVFCGMYQAPGNGFDIHLFSVAEGFRTETSNVHDSLHKNVVCRNQSLSKYLVLVLLSAFLFAES